MSTQLDKIECHERASVIMSKTIRLPRYVLTASGVDIVEDLMLSLYEASDDDNDSKVTHLPIVKGSRSGDNSGHYPTMPSLRLDMIDREYSEPIRDRNKNWVLQSQRNILNPPEPPPTLASINEQLSHLLLLIFFL